ncbi:DUF4065 domain-containing protein [Bacillus sp. 31A1R]|uniref:DUF4065 domain-containing protein n=1 Tax=Robertmurraya mangrovi TaxID=3098077 RepID=A0ABU5J4B2_9BACI|nr:type II TA system antitoxin MqsA family protein [Bacillus sp. 31A1R]MDZ5474181.1 DUF4065 domain-containing protein [Bacillus sp. 31A1R]
MGLFCHQCNCEQDYITVNKTLIYPVRGENIELPGTVAECTSCGFELFHPEYDVSNQNQAFNQYRSLHGLLAPDEIRRIRLRYNLSQRDFSRLLGFGEITISRYERGSLPTVAQNQMISESDSPNKILELIQVNGHKLNSETLKDLEELLEEFKQEEQVIKDIRKVFQAKPDVYHGYKNFSLDKVSQVVHFFATKERPYLTKLNKLLFYSDYYFYKKNNISITGIRYVRESFGPVPERFNTIFESIPIIELVEDEYGNYVRGIKEANYSLTNEELDILEFVYQKFKKTNARKISDFSHMERCWLETPQKAFISYNFAHDLNPKRSVH